MKWCVLDETVECDNCGECNKCDLDPNKICDNCMRCVNSDGAEYRAIEITGVQKPSKKGKQSDETQK